MALIKCRECERELSDEAEACPHCGAKNKKRTSWVTILLAILLAPFLLAFIFKHENNSRLSDAASSASNSPRQECAVSDIKIKSMQARFVDACHTRECYSMKGVAVLTNNCAQPIGVEIKITGLNAAGQPIASHDLWPASVSNIPPGDYTFSLDTYLEYDPRIKRFEMSAIDVRNWRSR